VSEALSPLVRRILVLLQAGPVAGDTIEAGLALLAERLQPAASSVALAEAVREGVSQGVLHDPVRLPTGALQCHWLLEPTARGRRMVEQPGGG
jgi:hypothetical protein